MSETQTQPQDMRQERPQQTRPKPATPQWSQEAADAAYNNAETFGRTLADREDAVEASMRDLIKAVYLFIIVIFSQSQLAAMRRLWKDATEPEDDDYALPREILKFLARKGIKKPHLRAANPFLSLVQHFVLRARVSRKQITAAEAKIIDAAAQDVDKQRKDKAAMSTLISRYAQLLLAAIDMDDPKILDKPFSFLAEYANWKNANPTLSAKFRAGPGKAAEAKAAKEAAKAATATEDKTSEILRQDDPFGDESFTDFDDGNADTMKVVTADGEPVNANEDAQPTLGEAPDTEAEPRRTPEQANAETAVKTAQSGLTEEAAQPAVTVALTTDPEATRTVEEAPQPASTMPASTKPTATDDHDAWWSGFVQSFERPYKPISLKVSRATVKELGLDETNEEGFLRYVVTGGELVITGVRHGADR